MNPAIFKAYDIRGIYPDELDASAAHSIGRALARHLAASRIVVGRDMRESGLALREALIEGLLSEGVEVVDIGRVATPMLYFATTTADASGGVMITASHNPGAYNGLKVCREQAIPIGIETGLREIRALAERCADEPPGVARAELRAQDVSGAYCGALVDLFPLRAPRRVVVDAGNGIAGEAVEPLLERLPLEVERLYFEPDGTFPNHEADPIRPENLRDLQRAVLASGAELGVAFDGDGDRAVFIDEQGEALPADLACALLVRFVLERGLGGAARDAGVVYDLRSSRVVREEIERCGGRPIRSRVGHAFIKQTMRDENASFGGELSGHYYFRFPSGYVADDGAAAMMLMLQVIEVAGQPLSQLWKPMRRYAQSGEVNRRVADAQAVARRVRAAFADGEADELDGLTVQYDDWWFNLRPSNTEPLVRLNVEASTQASMEASRDEITELMES
jgi:phosphomannomutase